MKRTVPLASGADRRQIELVQQYLENRSSGRPLPGGLIAAWRQFHADCSHRIRRFAVKCGMRGEDVDECIQEAWLAVIARLPAFDTTARGRFETWLYAVVRRKAIDTLRQRAGRPAASLDEVGHADDLTDPSCEAVDCSDAEDDLLLLGELLSKLRGRVSPLSYRVFSLRRLEERSVPEVAQLLDLTPAQVRTRTHRAEQKLRKLAACRVAQSATRSSSSRNLPFFAQH